MRISTSALPLFGSTALTMAVVQLKGLLLLIWIAIPYIQCQESSVGVFTGTDSVSELQTTTEDPFPEGTTLGKFQPTSDSEDNGTPQVTTSHEYLNVGEKGCLQQSREPATVATACYFCDHHGGTLVDLNVISKYPITNIIKAINITMWIKFNCASEDSKGSSKDCKTFYPGKNVSCTEEYNYFCFYNRIDDENCRINQDETTVTDTSTTTLSSTTTSDRSRSTSVGGVLKKPASPVDMSTGIILAVGVILFLSVIVGITGYCFYRRNSRRDPNGGSGEGDIKEDRPGVAESDLPEVEQTLSYSQKMHFSDDETYDHLGVQRKKETEDNPSNVYGHLIKEPNEGDYDTTNFQGPSTEVVDNLYARSNFEN